MSTKVEEIDTDERTVAQIQKGTFERRLSAFRPLRSNVGDQRLLVLGSRQDLG